MRIVVISASRQIVGSAELGIEIEQLAEFLAKAEYQGIGSPEDAVQLVAIVAAAATVGRGRVGKRLAERPHARKRSVVRRFCIAALEQPTSLSNASGETLQRAFHCGFAADGKERPTHLESLG